MSTASKKFKKRAGFDGLTKICSICGLRKELDQFHKQAAGIGGRTARCKSCANKIHKDRKWGSYKKGAYAKQMASIEGRASALKGSIAYRARAAKIDFDLDREWFVSRLRNGRCEVTNIPFRLLGNDEQDRRTNPFSPSVDRIDFSGGYTKTNCRMTILMFNMLKAEANDQQILEVCEALVARSAANGALEDGSR